jgi:hypothetical protein
MTFTMTSPRGVTGNVAFGSGKAIPLVGGKTDGQSPCAGLCLLNGAIQFHITR